MSLVAVATVVLGLAGFVPVANAASMKVDSFFPLDGVPSGAPGHFDDARDLDVNDPSITTDGTGQSGWVYVVDEDNHRVQAFDADGGFEFMIGRDVSVSQTTGEANTGYETCTSVPDCKGGTATTFAGVLGGMFDDPQGVAVDQSNGHFFVRDRDNRRVQEFTATGAFVQAFGADVDLPTGGSAYEVCTVAANCKVGVTGAGAGAFASSGINSNGIAVSPVNGHVFVADPGNRRLSELDPDAADGAILPDDADAYPDSFVRSWGVGVDTGSTTEFQICTIGSTCQIAATSSAGFGPGPGPGGFATNSPIHVAVDADGTVYAHAPGGEFALNPIGPTGKIERYDSTVIGDGEGVGSAAEDMLLEGFAAGLTPNSIDVDATSDRLYLGQSAAAGIRSYDISAGGGSLPVETADSPHMVGSGLLQQGIAHNAALGRLYVTSSTGAAHRVYVLDDDGAAGEIDATILPPADVEAKSATLRMQINPQGFPTTFQFQVSTTGLAGDWQDVGAVQNAGSGTASQTFSAPVSGLEANTFYRVRAVITRGFGNGSSTSPELFFVTDPAKPDVVTGSDPGPSATAVTLSGTVNPNNQATTYHFEYGTTTDYGTSVPVPAASAGSGAVPVAVSQLVTGLSPRVTYHYRLVATNAQGSSLGDDQAFTMRAASDEQAEGRRYELVTPSIKVLGSGPGAHASNSTLDGEFGLITGLPAVDGERFSTSTILGPMLVPAASVYLHNTSLADRTASGWVSSPAVNRRNYDDPGAPFFNMLLSSDNMELMLFENNGGDSQLFPEMVPTFNPNDVKYLRDGEGNWRLLAPSEADQGSPSLDFRDGGGAHLAADGSAMAFTSDRGMFGDSDPTHDQIPGSYAVYATDVSGGISDSFADRGPTDLVNVCTPGTEIPARIDVGGGDFEQAAQACPPVVEGRSAALISAGGASTKASGLGPASNMVSQDGSRTFFMSPDPQSHSPYNPPSACSGAGAATSCPAQLYVRQRNGDGSVTTRWISRSTITGQDASLMAHVYFDNATPDGDKVFFRTTAPLTADDPNGQAISPTDPRPIRTGTPNPDSWDLYMYDFPVAGDSGAGQLTRISRGSDDNGDGNVVLNAAASSSAAVRFVSDEGERVYFTASRPLPGVPAPSNGTITTPADGSSPETEVNLYLYDTTDPEDPEWSFITRLPRDAPTGSINNGDQCASTAAREGEPRKYQDGPPALTFTGAYSCVRGSADGGLLTFWTRGRLVANDPDGASFDMYAFDADAGGLSRMSAPQGGAGGSYVCETVLEIRCYADPGFAAQPHNTGSSRKLGVVTEPAVAGDKVAFFESRSRLVAGDVDDEMDVYRWRNGDLSLVSPGVEDTGAYYAGNSTDGEDLFVLTTARLSWQDIDAVRDVYDFRIGGGIPEPVVPVSCALTAACQDGSGAAAVSAAPTTASPGAGNADARGRKSLTVAGLSARARRKAARTGRLVLSVTTSAAGRVTATAHARIAGRARRVARNSVQTRGAGRTRLRLRLDGVARRRLAAGSGLRLAVRVVSPGARSRSMTVRLPGVKS